MVGFLVKLVNKIIISEDLKCSLLHHLNDEVMVKSITIAWCWSLKGLNHHHFYRQMKTTKIIIKRKEEWKKEEKGKEREKGKEETEERREKRH